MNPTLLIHSVVRQTMVLIAALATSSGQRTPLTNIADQVFSALVSELGEQGLGHKVIADMLGMALRTYHRRAARLSGSDTDGGQSLWAAVLAHLRAKGPLSRGQVLQRFHMDSDLIVRSVLRDLVDSGLVYQTGRADETTYRARETSALSPTEAASAAEQLLLVAIHQSGPIDAEGLRELVPLDDATFRSSLERLVLQGLIGRKAEGERELFRCDEVIIPLGSSAGWEAAVFDHYKAMVTAIVTKLRVGSPRSDLSDKIGGSTFTFDVWDGHPLGERVLGYLQAMRESGIALRSELDAFNKARPKPDDLSWLRVVAYVGQTVREEEDEDGVQD